MAQQGALGAVIYAKSIERVHPFYVASCGLRVTHVEDDHVVLDSPAFQLVILAVPESIAARIPLSTPPARRENTPIKLVFHVESIEAVRKAVVDLGGELDPPEREWTYQASRICDGRDPEGNVVQFRERAARFPAAPPA